MHRAAHWKGDPRLAAPPIWWVSPTAVRVAGARVQHRFKEQFGKGLARAAPGTNAPEPRVNVTSPKFIVTAAGFCYKHLLSILRLAPRRMRCCGHFPATAPR